MICRHYSIPMTLGKLRELANVTTQGATLDSLARAGESLGFTARGVQCTFDSLRGFDLPFIVHWEGYHYVVVYGLSTEYVWVADPALGFRKLTVEDFERGFQDELALFHLDAGAAWSCSFHRVRHPCQPSPRHLPGPISWTSFSPSRGARF